MIRLLVRGMIDYKERDRERDKSVPRQHSLVSLFGDSVQRARPRLTAAQTQSQIMIGSFGTYGGTKAKEKKTVSAGKVRRGANEGSYAVASEPRLF